METEIHKLTGVPNNEVSDVIADLQRSPRYLSHMVIPEGGGKSTIVAAYSTASHGVTPTGDSEQAEV